MYTEAKLLEGYRGVLYLPMINKDDSIGQFFGCSYTGRAILENFTYITLSFRLLHQLSIMKFGENELY